MEANLNPYATPATDSLAFDDHEAEVLQARFFVTPVWRQQIAYDFLMPGALLLFSSMLVLFAGLGLGALLGPVVISEIAPLGTMHAVRMGAVLIGFPLGAVGAVLFHIFSHQWLKRQNLRRLQQHPTLGADGEWLLEIDLNELRIKTDGGISQWPLTEVWWHFPHAELLLLQLPNKIAVGIPTDAELTPPRPERFKKLVRGRVRRMTLMN